MKKFVAVLFVAALCAAFSGVLVAQRTGATPTPTPLSSVPGATAAAQLRAACEADLKLAIADGPKITDPKQVEEVISALITGYLKFTKKQIEDEMKDAPPAGHVDPGGRNLCLFTARLKQLNGQVPGPTTPAAQLRTACEADLKLAIANGPGITDPKQVEAAISGLITEYLKFTKKQIEDEMKDAPPAGQLDPSGRNLCLFTARLKQLNAKAAGSE